MEYRDARNQAPVEMQKQPRRFLESSWFWGILYFATGFALILQGQFLSGIVHAEFGHFPDEPAHAMTAIFFRDYIAAHFPRPMAFAESYYLHYPKIAIGIWPPAFYLMAGTWLLIFGTAHGSFLAFIATMGASLATTLSLFVRRAAGNLLGWFSGILLLCLRPLRFGTTTMLVDTTLTLMCLLAALSLIRYLKTNRLRDALLFGFLTAIAMLTKGNAIYLLLFAPLLFVVTGCYRQFLKKDIYLAGVPIVLLGVPWQILSVRLLKNAALIQSDAGGGVAGKSIGYLAILFEQLGPVAIAGFAVFVVSRFFRQEENLRTDIAAAGCLVLAVYIFHVAAPVPGPDGRYMMGALPPLIFLFFTGVSLLARALTPRRSWMAYAGMALLVFAMPSGAWIITRHDRLGMEDVAKIVHDEPGRVILVNAESSAEGAFIVSLALLDRRPEHFVIRSSKLMSDNAWTSTEYHPLLKTPAEVLAVLDRIPVDTVVVDLTRTGWEQDRALLLLALRGDPADWRLTTDLPVSPRNSHHLLVFTSQRPRQAAMTEAQVSSQIKAALANMR